MTKPNQQDSLSDEALSAWISAWVDAEAELPEGSVRQLGNQAVLREKWHSYHLIGDVMRTPDLALQPSAGFRARLSAELDKEPAWLVVPQRRQRLSRTHWVSGLAVAAAVACVTWVALPLLTPDSPETLATVASAPAAPAVSANPIDVAFNDYLDAHRQLSGAAGGYRMTVSWQQEGLQH